MHAPDGTVIRGPERRQSPRTVGKPDGDTRTHRECSVERKRERTKKLNCLSIQREGKL